jgi:hypothetical protein
MEIKDIKRLIFEKWFFPDVIIINKPGVIISKVVKKFGRESSICRLAYIFEDVLADLQLDTIKKIGYEKTSDIWYRIGKDLTFSYFLVSKAKKPPTFLLDSIINYIFKHFFMTGIALASDMKFDRKNLSLVLKGKNNIIHRKTGLGSVLAGISSSVVSFLSGTNIEAQVFDYSYEKELYCKVVCSKKIDKKYIPDLEKIKELVKIYNTSIPKNYEDIIKSYIDFATLDKFLRFKQAKVIDNLLYFNNKAMMSGEINSADHIINNYIAFDIVDILKKSIVNSSKKIIKHLIEKKGLTQKEKLKFIQNMMSAFGWGIPNYKIEKNKITFDFIFGPQAITNSFLFYALQLNGFLNYIFNKELRLIDTKMILETIPISRAVYEIM